MNIYDENPGEYNIKLAEALKNIQEIEAPEWIGFVKSSPSKERPIGDKDFWHKRTASIMKQLHKRKVVGVGRLRVKYGSKKSRGYKPEEFRKSGGKIIRLILQQLDKAGFTETTKPIKGLRGKTGRQLTEKGKKFMEDLSNGN
ncbi:MAG: 40S ribosomal protein S19 [Candidatus Pacearchaeota archaeon]